MIFFYLLFLLTKKRNFKVSSGYIVSLPESVYNDNKIKCPQLLLKLKKNKYEPSSRVYSTNQFVFTYKPNILKEGKKIKLALNDNYAPVTHTQIKLYEIRRDKYRFSLETVESMKGHIINLWVDFLTKVSIEKKNDLSILNDIVKDEFILKVLDRTIKAIKTSKPKKAKKNAEDLYEIHNCEYKKYLKEKTLIEPIDKLTSALDLFQKTKDMVSYISSLVDPNKVYNISSKVHVDNGYINRCIIIEMMDAGKKVESIINVKDSMGVKFTHLKNLLIIDYYEIMSYNRTMLLISGENIRERIILINRPLKMSFELK